MSDTMLDSITDGRQDDDIIELPDGLDIYRELPNDLATELAYEHAMDVYNSKTFFESILDYHAMGNVPAVFKAIDALKARAGNNAVAIEYYVEKVVCDEKGQTDG